MPSNFVARLIGSLAKQNRAPSIEEVSEVHIDDACSREEKLLFAELLAASSILDFGGVPADFFQRRGRLRDDADDIEGRSV